MSLSETMEEVGSGEVGGDGTTTESQEGGIVCGHVRCTKAV